MSWDALPQHLVARIASSGQTATENWSIAVVPSAAPSLRLVSRSWQEAVDNNMQLLKPPRWPPPGADHKALCRVSKLDCTGLCFCSSACTPQSTAFDDCADGGGPNAPECDSEGQGSCSSSYSMSRSSSIGSQLDLMGAAVLQPRMQLSNNASMGSSSTAATSLMCYVASVWPEAVPHVTPAACLRLWRCLPQLQYLRHLQLSGSMLLMESVHTSVAGCPDAASGLRLLQQHAAEGGDSFAGIASPSITHTYTLGVPPALCSMTGLQSLSVEWQLQVQDSAGSSSSSGTSSGLPVRRRSYEGGGSMGPNVQHVADPVIRLPPQFSQLVNVQRLELSGHVAHASTLLPLLGLQRLQQLELGPGRISVQALVPLAAAGVLGGLTKLVLKQQGCWDVGSLVSVLAAVTKLQQLEVQELEIPSAEVAATGALQQALTAEDVSPLSRTLTHLSWCACAQRLAAGASLLCRSPSAAGLPGQYAGDVSAAAAGPWFGGLSALQCVELRGILRDGSVLGAPALDAVSSSIGGCSNLQKLSVKCLGLPVLPDTLAQLPLLQHVSIEACSVTRRAVLGPEAAIGVLGRCKQLQEITLAGCELRHVPEWLAGLQDVTVLQLRGNYLQDLPAEKPCMGLPPALQSLNLADNRLRQLPDSIVQLSSLSQLVLDSNYLTTLPGSIWDLPALRTLSARENMLSQLPECGSPCVESCSEGCAGNRICSTSGTSCSMGAVAAVHVAAGAVGNSLEFLQPGAFSTAAQPAEGLEGLSAEEEELLRAIGVLRSSRGLSGTPRLLCNGAGCAGAAVVGVPCVRRHALQGQEPCACAGSLRALVLADNQLTELPASFAQLSSLREVNLSKNQLRALPDKAGIWALTGLTNLQLADNHLRKLPAGLAKLQHLVELDVSGNHLSVSIAPERAHRRAAPAAVAVTSAVAVSAPAAVARVAGAGGPSAYQSGVSAAAPIAAAAGSSGSIWQGPAVPARSAVAPAPAAAPPAAAKRARAVSDGHALVTVVAEGPGAQDGSWPVGSSSGRSVRKQSRALPCPLGQLPELQQVCLGRQQVEGSKWCGQCPLQLLLAGLSDLAERIRALAPPNHQCPVKKAAVAAVAHITGVANASRARAARERELLQRMQTEPGWVVFPAKAAPSHV